MMYSSVHSWKDARIFFKEAKSLAKRYEVDFYAVGDEKEATEHESRNLKIKLLSARKRMCRPLLWKLLFREIRNSDAQYYHFHDPELLLLLPFLKRTKKNGIFIYDMHENFPAAILSKTWIPKLFRKTIAQLVTRIELYCFRHLDGIIFAESSYKTSYSTIPTHIKQEDIYNYPLHVAKTNPIIKGTEDVKFIYIGRIAEIRGVWIMINLIQLLLAKGKKVSLQLIGPCDEMLLKRLQNYLDEKKLGEYITYVPYVEHDEIWKFYKEAQIGLCLLEPVPNYLNSMATKNFEYMASSLPMIVSDFPSWKHLIEKSNCGFAVNPSNIEELQKRATDLIENKDKRELFGQNGRKSFEDKYNWDIEERKLLKFYKNLEG